VNLLGFEFSLAGTFYLGEQENLRLLYRWTVGENYIVTVLNEKAVTDWRVRLEVLNESLIDVNHSTYIVHCDQVWYAGYVGRKVKSQCSIRARWRLNKKQQNTFQINHDYQTDCGIDAMLQDGLKPNLYVCTQPTITRPDGCSLNVALSLEDAIIAKYSAPWNHRKTRARAMS
jgi:hypothetical protein